MSNKLNVLLIEDNESDAELSIRHLSRSGYDVFAKRIDTLEEVENNLRDKRWDVILSDYKLPQLEAPRVYEIYKSHNLKAPFIVVSGAVGEEAAVQIVKGGAHDYVMKNNLQKLPLVIKRELEEAENREKLEKAQEQLLIANQYLEEALLSKDEFLIIASHELKTPLTSLKLKMQFLRRKNEDDEKLINDFDVSIHQINRLANIIENMLDTVRIQSGSLTLQLEQVNISNTLQEVLKQFSTELERSHCKTVVNIEPDIKGYWDHSRLIQIFYNLFSNVVKFAPQSTIEIAIAQNVEKTTIHFSDNGPGISESIRPLIFNRFEKEGLSINSTGLGLGLFICKNIVEALGGSIMFESYPGKGTKFKIELPNFSQVHKSSQSPFPN